MLAATTTQVCMLNPNKTRFHTCAVHFCHLCFIFAFVKVQQIYPVTMDGESGDLMDILMQTDAPDAVVQRNVDEAGLTRVRSLSCCLYACMTFLPAYRACATKRT